MRVVPTLDLEAVHSVKKVTPSDCDSPHEAELPQELCRICFEASSNDHELIAPCRCTGTVKYVHEDCMKTWVLSLDEDLSAASCELCKTQLKMKVDIQRRCATKESCHNNPATFVFTPLLLCVLGMLVLIIYLLSKRYIDQDLSSSQQGYSLALMVACSIAALVVFVMLIHSCKEHCVTAQVKQWTILPQEFPTVEKPAEASADQTHLNNLNEGSLLVLPRRLRYRGMRVERPQLAPVSLTPINRRGRLVAFRPRTDAVQSLCGSASVSQVLEIPQEPEPSTQMITVSTRRINS